MDELPHERLSFLVEVAVPYEVQGYASSMLAMQLDSMYRLDPRHIVVDKRLDHCCRRRRKSIAKTSCRCDVLGAMDPSDTLLEAEPFFPLSLGDVLLFRRVLESATFFTDRYICIYIHILFFNNEDVSIFFGGESSLRLSRDPMRRCYWSS